MMKVEEEQEWWKWMVCRTNELIAMNGVMLKECMWFIWTNRNERKDDAKTLWCNLCCTLDWTRFEGRVWEKRTR